MLTEALGLVAAALAAMAALAVGWRRYRHWRRWARCVLSRPGMRLAREGLWSGVRVVHTEGELVVDVAARTRPREQPVWELTARPMPLGQRTTLSIGREGTYTRPPSSEGWQDPRTEIDSIDKRYRIGGSLPPVVRAVTADPDVRHAVVALFERRQGYVGCQLKVDGLVVVVSRDALAPDEALGWLLAVRGLAEALDRVSGIAPASLPPRDSGIPPDGPGRGSWIPRPASHHGDLV